MYPERGLNGSAIATRSRSNGSGSVSTSGVSITGYGTQYRSETGRDAIGARFGPFIGVLALSKLVSTSQLWAYALWLMLGEDQSPKPTQ